MIKELSKTIYARSRLRKKFCKTPSKENDALYKIQHNKCLSLRRKIIKEYFNSITKYKIATNSKFWNLFLQKKVILTRFLPFPAKVFSETGPFKNLSKRISKRR